MWWSSRQAQRRIASLAGPLCHAWQRKLRVPNFSRSFWPAAACCLSRKMTMCRRAHPASLSVPCRQAGKQSQQQQRGEEPARTTHPPSSLFAVCPCMDGRRRHTALSQGAGSSSSSIACFPPYAATDDQGWAAGPSRRSKAGCFCCCPPTILTYVRIQQRRREAEIERGSQSYLGPSLLFSAVPKSEKTGRDIWQGKTAF